MRDSLGRFIKGAVSENKGKKMTHSGSFKKGHKNGFKKGYTPWNKGMAMSEEFCNKLKGRSKELSSSWRGGIKFSGGYRLIYSETHPYKNNSGYVREQRLVVESIIKRYLVPSEKVHHIDFDKFNNSPNNLIAFSSESAHQRFHHNPNNVKSSEIIFDGRIFSDKKQ